MEPKEKNTGDFYTIDLLYLVKALWKRAWAILLIGIAAAVGAAMFTIYCITPKYSASVMLYVNNRAFSIGSTGVSISASEISAAQSLVDTYITILNNRTTMKQVIDHTDVDRTYRELLGMVSAQHITGTEVFRVTVTSEDAYEARDIANGIAEVLPERISEIIEGSSMRVVDDAIVNLSPVSPSITRNVSIALILGCLCACFLFAVLAILDDTIRSEDHLVRSYDIPVLSKIPRLKGGRRGRGYGYGYGYGRNPYRSDSDSMEREEE